MRLPAAVVQRASRPYRSTGAPGTSFSVLAKKIARALRAAACGRCRQRRGLRHSNRYSRTGVTRAIVADVDWPVLRAVYETRRAKPLLSRVAAGRSAQVVASSNGADASSDQLPEIDFASLRPIERRSAIELAVRREVAKVVGLRSPERCRCSIQLVQDGTGQSHGNRT